MIANVETVYNTIISDCYYRSIRRPRLYNLKFIRFYEGRYSRDPRKKRDDEDDDDMVQLLHPTKVYYIRRMVIDCSYDELVAIDELKPHPKNNNRHSIEQIHRLAKIILYQDMRSPIVVSKRSGFIVKGHCRLEALKEIEWEKAPVNYQDYESEAQEYADMTADNELARWAELDVHKLHIDLEGMDIDLDMLGLENFSFLKDEKKEDKEDDVPEVKHDPVTKRGDIWLLGDHRVMCGDSTMIDDVEKLMNGEKADMVFTDPPYGMNAVSKSGVLTKSYKKDILNDDSVDVAKDSYRLCEGLGIEKMVFWGANYYSSALPDSTCWLVWDKNNGGSDQMDCELAWTNFKGCTRQFTQASEKTNRVHPTQNLYH